MSRTTKVKSLRDCLLKSTVVNFNKIFLEDTGVVKNHICLPLRLFEDIQHKSHEICWIIPHKSWIACLSNRDALNWVNIDLRLGALTLDDLLQMEKSDFPIKRLIFRTRRLTDAMLDVIEKFSSTIELLEIDYCNTPQYVDISKMPKQTMIKFPKLKVLSARLNVVPVQLLQRFDMSSCSDSLKKLCLFGYLGSSDKKEVERKLILEFIDSLKVLKNLESLTIKDENICNKMDFIVHLKNLKTLDLRSMPSNIPPGQNLVNILPKLENLTIPKVNLIDELNALNGKRLNYVGLNFKADIPEHLKEVVNIFGSFKDFQSYLKFMDYSYSCYDYTYKTYHFMEMLDSWQHKSILFTGAEKRKAEKGILAHIIWDFFEVEFCVNAITRFKNIWSHNFIIKITNLVTSLKICEEERFRERIERFKNHFLILLQHQPLIDYKKGYIALNPNSSISKLYKIIPPVV